MREGRMRCRPSSVVQVLGGRCSNVRYVSCRGVSSDTSQSCIPVAESSIGPSLSLIGLLRVAGTSLRNSVRLDFTSGALARFVGTTKRSRV